MSRQLALSSALSILAMASLVVFGTVPARSSPFIAPATTSAR